MANFVWRRRSLDAAEKRLRMALAARYVGGVKVPIRKVSTSFERFKRWFRRTAGSAEDSVEGGSPVTTSPPGANPVGGDVEQETSTNAQMEGAADEPWSGNT
jgi:hypothetical protein